MLAVLARRWGLNERDFDTEFISLKKFTWWIVLLILSKIVEQALGKLRDKDMSDLTTDQLSYVEQRLSNDKKSIFAAYALWFFLGPFGAHRYYLGHPNAGLFILAFVGAIVLSVAISPALGIISALVLYIAIFVDAFRIPAMLTADTEKKRKQIMDEIRSK